MPDYKEKKVELQRQFPQWKTDWNAKSQVMIELCFVCLEQRLGRALTEDDFDLSLPINGALALGFSLGRSSRARTTCD